MWKSKSPRLSHLDCELTERCDNACQHCYINLAKDDHSAQTRELSAAEWGRILSEAAELGTLTVRFTGGEPLLREDFNEIYLHARKLGMKVQLFTNARGVSEELADLFATVPPLEKIEVTVYGMRAESYDAAACAPGAYGEFRRGIERLLARRVAFIVKWAMLPPNRDEWDEFLGWAKTLPGMGKEMPGAAMFFDLRARRDSAQRNRLIERLRIDPEEGATLLFRKGNGFRKEMREFCSRFMGPAGERLFECGAGSGGSVDAYGRYQACLLLRDPRLSYDLRSGSLREGLEHFSSISEMKATNAEYLQRCARCFLHGLCEQCPAKAWSEHGELDRPVEYLCQAAHAQARMLELLKEGEKGWEIRDWRERVEGLENEGA